MNMSSFFPTCINFGHIHSQGLPNVHVTHWILKPTLNQHGTFNCLRKKHNTLNS